MKLIPELPLVLFGIVFQNIPMIISLETWVAIRPDFGRTVQFLLPQSSIRTYSRPNVQVSSFFLQYWGLFLGLL